MGASPLATVVSGYMNEICLGAGGGVNGIGEATRTVGVPLGATSRPMQRVPETQGSRASQPHVRAARVRDLRGSRAPAHRLVPQLRGGKGAAGARAVLCLLQAG